MRKRGFEEKEGFALVPVVLVLLVVASLLTFGILTFGPLVKRGKVNETKDTLDAAVKAIISWAAANGRLPCEGNDNAGYCNSQGDEFTPAVRNPSDAWAKSLFYVYDNQLADPAQGGLCGRSTTNLTVRVCPDAGCAMPSAVLSNVALVVLSAGENFNNQTFGTAGVAAANTVNVYDSTVTIDAYTGDMNRSETYDDIVRWVTLDELKNKAGCYGTTGGRLRIINNELPRACANTTYSATVYAEGGVPFSGSQYQWCIQGFLPSGLTANPNTACPSWSSNAASLQLGGSATSLTSASLVFMVRDNDPTPNVFQRAMTLQVASCGGGGSDEISFAGNIPDSGFVTNVPNASGAAIDYTNNTVVMGSSNADGTPDQGSTVGCVWYQTPKTLEGKTMLSYFDVRILQDSDSRSKDYADGFTFTVMTSNNPTSTCGSQGDGMGYNSIPGKSVAIEFDTYYQNNKNDPLSSQNVFNHVAFIQNGTNVHNSGGNPACLSAGCVRDPSPTPSATWLEDNVTHKVRIEIDATAGAGNIATVKVWVCDACANLNDLDSNYTSVSPSLTHSFTLDPTMTQVIFGFTEGSAGQPQYIVLSNFTAKFR